MMRHAIYVPGLGDNYHTGQRIALWFWRLFGVRVHYLPLIWADGQPFEPKFERLLRKIDELLAAGKTVSLVGVSAGAGAALNAYAERQAQIHCVVLIVGKVRNPHTISDRVYRKNPAFKGSMNKLDDNLKRLGKAERQRILSIHGVTDLSVPPSDTLIDDANEKKIPTMGHVPSIAWAITLGNHTICRFIRSEAK